MTTVAATAPIRTWADLVDREARFAVLLEAALSVVGPNGELHAEAVYVMCKPLVGWLAGPMRGRPPKESGQLPPVATRLRQLFAAARPFTSEPSGLDDHRAYDVANAHINSALHDRQDAETRRRDLLDDMRAKTIAAQRRAATARGELPLGTVDEAAS